MYFRKKTSGGRAYLQIAHSQRVGGQVRQRVIATLGRLDVLASSGQLERLVRSAADRSREDYRIAGAEALELHHLYRAIAWLGKELPAQDQDNHTPFAPRCTKDLVEEQLFAHRRDLFSRLDLVFMDTTSLYFEGAGGQTLGRHGHSKDHRPDLPQMILAVLIDGDGRPVCSEMWPGNTANVKTLIPVLDRLRRRFAIGRICVVADRGMISAEQRRHSISAGCCICSGPAAHRQGGP